MNGALLLLTGLLVFILFYIFYGSFLKKQFGIDKEKKTPAHNLNDGIDYVPTPFPVLFGHHFASIAGAGPIVGPVLGACFGWLPVALWIVIGCIAIGAVHDFASVFVSVRNEGRSIGSIIERYLGYGGKQIFLLFCFAALVLVVAIFALLVAKTFTGLPSVATSSVLFIAIAPLFGYLVQKKNVSIIPASLIFVPLLFLGIYLGTKFPLNLVDHYGITPDLTRKIWLGVLFVYVFIASIVPVWALLQPRDYLNSFLLYGMIILGFLGILVTAPSLHLPAFTGFSVLEPTKGVVNWDLFPILFVTIACGACSGFHALVSSGTTSKQIKTEAHIFPIGYGAMLVEGVLALMALISVAVLSKEDFIVTLKAHGPVNSFAKGLAAFCSSLHVPYQTGETFIALTISAFMLTTLDTATRLTRFTVQELVSGDKQESVFKSFFQNRYISTSLVTVISAYLAFSGDGGKIWPVFGASNQLLAALTLLVISVILFYQQKKYWITFIPFVFMWAISFWALIKLWMENIKISNWTMIIAISFLTIMSVMMIVQSFFKIFSGSGKAVEAAGNKL